MSQIISFIFIIVTDVLIKNNTAKTQSSNTKSWLVIGIISIIIDNKVSTIGTNIPKPIICKTFFSVKSLILLCINLGEIYKPISHKIIAETNTASKEYM